MNARIPIIYIIIHIIGMCWDIFKYYKCKINGSNEKRKVYQRISIPAFLSALVYMSINRVYSDPSFDLIVTICAVIVIIHACNKVILEYLRKKL